MDPLDPAAARARDVDELARGFITYVAIPAWVAAGLLDWYWHRRTKIECNAGAHESLTHILMALQGGAIGAALLFEIDAGIIAAMFAAAVAHEATAVWDVGYALPRRRILQAEDHTHSFMEALPFAAAAVTAYLHPAQTRALLGAGPAEPRFAFRLRPTPLPVSSLVALAGGGLLGVLPYVEEMVRCLRVRPTLAPEPVDQPPPSS